MEMEHLLEEMGNHGGESMNIYKNNVIQQSSIHAIICWVDWTVGLLAGRKKEHNERNMETGKLYGHKFKQPSKRWQSGETHDKTCGKHINNKTSRERNIWTPRIIKDQHIPKYINTNQNISVGFFQIINHPTGVIPFVEPSLYQSAMVSNRCGHRLSHGPGGDGHVIWHRVQRHGGDLRGMWSCHVHHHRGLQLRTGGQAHTWTHQGRGTWQGWYLWKVAIDEHIVGVQKMEHYNF